MMPPNIDKFYETVLKLSKEGGKLIKQRIWCQKTVQTKSGETDLVTETDHEVEKLLVNGLSEQFPDHKFIGEETTASGVKPELTVSPTWIIDPVDGTMNFVHGYPIVTISIALLIDKVPEIGIIYNPILEQLFTARRGQGAFLNGNKINVSSTEDLSKSLLTIESGTKDNLEKLKVTTQNLKTLTPLIHGIRGTGSSAWNIAMVGLGGSDGYLEFGLHVWDMAAGVLIVREAGGTVIDPTGGPLDLMSCRLLCTSTPKLAQQIVEKIEQYYPPRDE